MIRLSALFWLVLVSATGFAMFAVKYEVQALADQFAQTTKRTDDAERDIRVLDAEWAYLNRPDALAQMNQRYLSLAPIATKQLIASVSVIPMRPPPPPPAPVVDAAAVAEISPAQGAALPSQQPSAPSRPNERAAPVVTAALETREPAETRGAAPEPAHPLLIKAAARPGQMPPRVRSLDELIARIAENR
jgi:cell division protein FtsL